MNFGEGRINEDALNQAADLVLEGNPPELFAVPGPFLLSVSGGPDSMLLLYVFRVLRERGVLEQDPAVFHLHHGLRSAAEGDLNFVIQEARGLGLACYYERRDVAGFARRLGKGLEAAGRLMRYRALARIQTELPGAVALTGHNADDYAESVLMHLVRGGGPAAMKTMPLFARLEGAAVARPLLCLESNRIRELVRAAKIPFVIDETNESDEFLRNRLRKRVLPELYREGLNPGRLRRNFHDDNPTLPGESSAGAMPEFGSRPESPAARPEHVRIDRSLLDGATRSETKTLLDIALRRLGLPPAGETSVDHALRATHRLRTRFETKDFLLWSAESGPLRIMGIKGSLFRSFDAEPEEGSAAGKQRIRIDYGGRRRSYELGPDEETALWSPGMYVNLAGVGRKKVKKIFQELRLPPPVRRNLPLIRIREGPVVRICLSFWEGEDRLYPAD